MSNQATLPNEAINILLNKVKRTQMVAGKAQDQVKSCVLEVKSDPSPVACVTSLVKDGLTSLSRFSCMIDRQEPCRFYITDIDTFLGALKYHATKFTLIQDGEKLRIKSSNKQTTLTASPDALAFPHNPATLREWHTTSTNLANKLIRNMMASTGNEAAGAVFEWHYQADGGVKIPTQFRFKTDGVTLYEAVRCDSMNGQKINRYNFFFDWETSKGFEVRVGKELKGQTTTVLDLPPEGVGAFKMDATFEGGLEQLTYHLNGPVSLNFLDFSHHGQGYKLIIDLGDNDFVFQSSVR